MGRYDIWRSLGQNDDSQVLSSDESLWVRRSPVSARKVLAKKLHTDVLGLKKHLIEDSEIEASVGAMQ